MDFDPDKIIPFSPHQCVDHATLHDAIEAVSKLEGTKEMKSAAVHRLLAKHACRVGRSCLACGLWVQLLSGLMAFALFVSDLLAFPPE